MQTIDIECPKCGCTNQVGEELIGCYTLCRQCGCRFYVPVPPLADAIEPTNVIGARITLPVVNITPSGDLAWETPQTPQLLFDLLRRQQRTLNLILGGLGILVIVTITTLAAAIVAMVE